MNSSKTKFTIKDAKLVLNTELVKPGDVLLLTTTEKISGWIRIATSGEYSHGALMLSGDTLLESDIPLVRHRNLPLTGFRMKTDGTAVWYVTYAEHVTSMALYRHPELEEYGPERVKIELGLHEQEFLGLNYSLFGRMVKLVSNPWLKPFRPLFQCWAKRKDRQSRREKRMEGPFCSELVSGFFRRLGLKLFDAEILPAEVLPKQLAFSKLRLVEGAVIAWESIADFIRLKDWDPYQLDLNWVTLSELMNKHRIQSDECKRLLDGMEPYVQSLGQTELTENIVQDWPGREKILNQTMELSERTGQHDMKERGRRLLEQGAEVVEKHKHLKPPFWKAPIVQYWLEFDRAVLLCGHLCTSRFFKRQIRADSTTSEERKKYEKIRRELLQKTQTQLKELKCKITILKRLGQARQKAAR